MKKGASIQHPLGNLNLPTQLPEARLHELVGKVRAGTASKGEIEELALGHIRLALSIASRHAVHALHKQDLLVNEALYGLAVALARAPEKLYDENITPFIVKYIRKYCFKALVEDQTVRVPHSTIKDREKRGLSTKLPKASSRPSQLATSGSGGLYELKDMIEASIKEEFEKQVVDLRALGHNDLEIAEILKCSRPPVTKARGRVYNRFKEMEQRLNE